MRRYGKHTDEDDIRSRPNRKGNRPRTHTRPKHEDAAEGMVLTVDRGRLTCLVEDRIVMAMKARELGRKAAIVGDRVALVGDLSGKKDTLARIVRIEERTSVLRRTADDDDPTSGSWSPTPTSSPSSPPSPTRSRVPASSIAAWSRRSTAGSPAAGDDQVGPRPPDELLELYGALDIPYVVTSREELENGDAADRVREHLDGKVTAFVGHSGVGKTTLVNALVPEDRRRTTGHVNAVTGRGRHTTTSALALPLSSETGGWVVDTPGVRSFGLAHIDPSRVIHAFPDLEPGTEGCPRACSHDEPDCALDAWVAEGHADPARLYSLRRLLSTRERTEGD